MSLKGCLFDVLPMELIVHCTNFLDCASLASLSWSCTTLKRFHPVLQKRGIYTKVASHLGFTELLFWLKDKGYDWKDSGVTLAAASGGHIAILEQVFDLECPSCEAAATTGQLHVLKWILRNRFRSFKLLDSIFAAATSGQLSTVHWLDSLKEDWHPAEASLIVYAALKGGHLPVLEWVWEKEYYTDDPGLVRTAVTYKKWEVVKWLYKKGHWWQSESLFYHMALANNKEMIEWAQEIHGDSILRSEAVTRGAGTAGHLDLLKWAVDKGYPLCNDLSQYTGSVEVLQWAFDHGVSDASYLLINALSEKNMKVAGWAIDHGCPWPDAKVNKLSLDYSTVVWMFDNGWPGDESALTLAIYNGDVKFLERLVDKGFPLTSDLVSLAVNQLDVLNFLRARDCPWDPSVVKIAAKIGYLETLKWLKDNAPPFDEEMVRAKANKRGYKEVLEWLEAEERRRSSEHSNC